MAAAAWCCGLAPLFAACVRAGDCSVLACPLIKAKHGLTFFDALVILTQG
jgi:hypothetical protein